jgi:hypothetical protein
MEYPNTQAYNPSNIQKQPPDIFLQHKDLERDIFGAGSDLSDSGMYEMI